VPVVVDHEYGADLEGKDVKIGEKDYIAYLDDGEQLFSLLSLLTMKPFDQRITV
jgi:hypothetical protein